MKVQYPYVVALLLLCIFSNVVSAEEQAVQPLNPQDTEVIKKNAQALGTLFGVEQQKPTPSTGTQQQGKSMAEVAEKAIDLTAQAVATIASTIQKIAPDIWRIMLKQQYVKGVQGLVVPLGILLLIFVYRAKIAPKCFPVPTEENGMCESYEEKWTRIWLANIIPVALAFLSGTWGANRLSDCLGYLINPEFYAIQDLLRTILAP